MTHNPTKWKRSHDALAKDLLKKLGISRNPLPVLPKDPFEWIKAARPKVEGINRSFLAVPFWVPIYKDQSNSQMIMGGRQIYKSTACTDFIAMEATTNQCVQVCYVTFDETNLSGFSKQKLQAGTFSQNPILGLYPRNKTGNVHEISLKNGSTIYLTTDADQYKHVEGKSIHVCFIDEAQYQELENLNRVHQTMMATKGKLKIFGIGGEAGSPYEKLWKSTNQMEWHYYDPNWREKLEFNASGLVIDEYLRDVLRGRWIAKNPTVTDFNGYHIPQTIVPTIPLTIQDATEKYKIHRRFSIEFQRQSMSPSDYITHVLGGFYHSSRRPITLEMVLSCMNPYQYLSLFDSQKVADLKEIFGNKIKIAMGVDFGSGSNSSSTAIAILIWWRETDRIQIAWIEKRPKENQLRQAQYIADMFGRYSCDVGVGDLGYGQIQVKLIQDGGYDNDTGVKYSGVGNTKFFGCRTISDETKPLQSFDKTIDEHGEQVGRLQIDKTSSIDSLIATLEKSIPNPFYPDDAKKARQQLIIPSKHMPEVDFLVNDLTSVTRKDLEEISDYVTEDGRQRATKQYNHPPDSVMALIYALTALKHETRWNWVRA
ncbi:MAG: terminase large subunit domain-containing protein [Nitrosarchaeum sp.]